MNSSLFFPNEIGSLPDLTELAIDVAAERQRYAIERQLADRVQHRLQTLIADLTAAGIARREQKLTPPAPQQDAGANQTPAAVAFRYFMCAWCDRPIDQRGSYVTLAVWEMPKSWSHGICPSCRLRLLRERDLIPNVPEAQG